MEIDRFKKKGGKRNKKRELKEYISMYWSNEKGNETDLNPSGQNQRSKDSNDHGEILLGASEELVMKNQNYSQNWTKIEEKQKQGRAHNKSWFRIC